MTKEMDVTDEEKLSELNETQQLLNRQLAQLGSEIGAAADRLADIPRLLAMCEERLDGKVVDGTTISSGYRQMLAIYEGRDIAATNEAAAKIAGIEAERATLSAEPAALEARIAELETTRTQLTAQLAEADESRAALVKAMAQRAKEMADQAAVTLGEAPAP